MKKSNLSKTENFWKKLFFRSNVNRMRSALLSYLQSECFKCDIAAGFIVFKYENLTFSVSFSVEDQYAECKISCRCVDKNYDTLSYENRFVMAALVNDLVNHAILIPCENWFLVTTSFYFTSKSMMINLFAQHFNELTECINNAERTICDELEEQKAKQNRRIGFTIEVPNKEENQQQIERKVASEIISFGYN